MFNPRQVIFLKNSLNYEMGQEVYNFFKNKPNVDIFLENSNVVSKFFNKEPYSEFYQQGKRTLILGVKQVGPFQTCKPSADYQMPLVSGCMGQCEYCYLQTQLKNNPYVKVNVNLEDIYEKAMDYINQRDSITVFEGAATSDVLPIEPYTKILSKTIGFFGNIENARFRFVSKYTDVDNLLNVNHNDHTEIRFSINTDNIIKEYEHLTPSVKKRLEAARKVLDANYRVGFLIAPVFIYDNYQEDYYKLLEMLKEEVKGYEDKISFEIISHRFTSRAKQAIYEAFPDTSLDLEESNRVLRMGQFGYHKYMYKLDEMKKMKEFFKTSLVSMFPNSEILYII